MTSFPQGRTQQGLQGSACPWCWPWPSGCCCACGGGSGSSGMPASIAREEGPLRNYPGSVSQVTGCCRAPGTRLMVLKFSSLGLHCCGVLHRKADVGQRHLGPQHPLRRKMTLDGTHLVQMKAPGLGLENPQQTTLQLLWALSSLSPLSVSPSLEA